MVDHLIDPTLLIPVETRDNYVAKVRSEAAQLGVSVADRWAAQVADFQVQHGVDGLAGWDHLAVWARDVDPDTYGLPAVDPVAVARMRALESEKREPTAAGLFTSAEQEQLAAEVAHARRTSGAEPDAEGEDDDGSPAAKRRKAKGQRTAAEATPKREV